MYVVTEGTPAPRLLDEVRRRLRLKHYSLRTEQAYIGGIRRFILCSGKRHPRAMGATEVERLLSVLAVRGQVAASTHNQALAALLFLYREVLELQLPWMNDIHRAQQPERLPTVLSRDEVQALLALPAGPCGMTRRGTRPGPLRRASAGSCAVGPARPTLHASRMPRGCAACASRRRPRERVA